jgi:hypothetical protein
VLVLGFLFGDSLIFFFGLLYHLTLVLTPFVSRIVSLILYFLWGYLPAGLLSLVLLFQSSILERHAVSAEMSGSNFQVDPIFFSERHRGLVEGAQKLTIFQGTHTCLNSEFAALQEFLKH